MWDELIYDEDVFELYDLDSYWLDLTVRKDMPEFMVLVLAVVKQAVMDYVIYPDGHGIKESAREFLFSEDLEIFCEFLEIKVSEVREKLWKSDATGAEARG